MKNLFLSLFFCFFSLNLFAQSWQELNEKGMQAYQAGNYKEAISYFEKALKQAEKKFGKNHENYATSCNNLAWLYDEQGRYAEAEPLYKEAKEIVGKVLGKEHL
jgi:tetratricopeptide (TPR) repeat protein